MVVVLIFHGSNTSYVYIILSLILFLFWLDNCLFFACFVVGSPVFGSASVLIYTIVWFFVTSWNCTIALPRWMPLFFQSLYCHTRVSLSSAFGSRVSTAQVVARELTSSQQRDSWFSPCTSFFFVPNFYLLLLFCVFEEEQALWSCSCRLVEEEFLSVSCQCHCVDNILRLVRVCSFTPW